MNAVGNTEVKNSLVGNIHLLKVIHGYSAYELAVKHGYKGTEEEWLDSLNGTKGDTGMISMHNGIDALNKRVVNVASPEEDSDAINRKYAEENFAPSGYGLGEKITKDIKFADIAATGFYRSYDSTIPNYNRNGGLLVEVIDGGTAGPRGIIKYSKAVSSIDGTIVHRVESNNTNREWRYQNPPMKVGGVGQANMSEYKTIERWNGKSVYTGLLQIKWQEGGGTDFDAKNAPVIKYAGYVGKTTLPNIDGTYDNANSCWLTFSEDSATGFASMKMHGGANHNGQTAYIQIWWLGL